MKLTHMQWVTLGRVHSGQFCNLDIVGVHYRQQITTLELMSPPLVEIKGNYAAVTKAGRDALAKRQDAR